MERRILCPIEPESSICLKPQHNFAAFFNVGPTCLLWARQAGSDLVPSSFVLPAQDTLFLFHLSAEAGVQAFAFECMIFGDCPPADQLGKGSLLWGAGGRLKFICSSS